MVVLVDTNVLLRVVEPRHRHHLQALTAIRQLRRAGDELCVVPQVHYEFWVAATRAIAQNGLGLTPAEAEATLQRFGPPLFRLLRDERAIYEPWRQLVSDNQVLGKQAHDTRLVAAMLRHRVTHLLTYNLTDFQRFPGIHLVDPGTF